MFASLVFVYLFIFWLNHPRSKRLVGGRVTSSHCTKGSSKYRGRKTFHRRNTQHLSQADGWSKLWDLPEEPTGAMSSLSTSNSTSLPQGGSSKETDSQTQNHSSASSNRLVIYRQRKSLLQDTYKPRL